MLVFLFGHGEATLLHARVYLLGHGGATLLNDRFSFLDTVKLHCYMPGSPLLRFGYGEATLLNAW